ncbi:MAG TPA: RIP metalloprotease RseP [Steroidobacteraceae bacterium]|nr:RIP metalloprotease RseP [Steroidobacteraceae bacterium]
MTLAGNLVWWIGGFIVAVGILVAVHEFGHFWVARRLGFKVERFKIGFMKTLWSRRLGDGETEFAIGAVPLGGYVKMLDERDGPVDPKDLPRSFTRRPVWQRILVLLAGPGFNLLFAVLLYSIISAVPTDMRRLVVGAVFTDTPAARAGLKPDDEFVSINGRATSVAEFPLELVRQFIDAPEVTVGVSSPGRGARDVTLKLTDEQQRAVIDGDPLELLGFTFWAPDDRAVVLEVTPDGPAQAAGIRKGDRILGIDGQLLRNTYAARQVIGTRGGMTVPVRIERAGEILEIPVAVRTVTEKGRRFGKIGIGFDPSPEVARPAKFPRSMIVTQRLGLVEAFAMGFTTTRSTCEITVTILWKMVTGKVSPRNLGGPVSIARAAGDSARAGLFPFLQLLAFISVSLAILNLLPVPVLDGGQIVYQLAEALRGRPLSERAQVLGQQIGLVMIAVLLSFVLVNDFTRNF